MQMKLKPWGNSQGLRFSKEILGEAGFSLDETLEVKVIDGQIILKRAFQHRSLKDRASDYGGQLNLSDEISWEKPEGSEVW